MVKTIHYLHSNGVMHRDIKLENMMLKNDRLLKFIDFMYAGEGEEGKLFKTSVGTPNFMAP